MRKTIKLAALALLASVTAASADSGIYGGLYTGSLAKKSDPWYGNLYLGGNIGYQLNSFARVEATYDYNRTLKADDRNHAVTGNFITQLDVSWLPITPYALAGVGYRWSDVKNEYIWNVGGGVRYPINDSIDLDARYRYISNFDRDTKSNVVTVGVNYKF